MDNYFDKDKIREALTANDIKLILADLGSGEPSKESDTEMVFSTCICHGGDSQKLYYYLDSKTFHCYTCGDNYDIYELVIRARRIQGITLTFPQAVKYVANVTNNMLYSDVLEKLTQKIDDWEWINKFKSIKKKKSIPQLTEISEHILEIFCSYPHEAWLSEGISKESMKKYQISYWDVGNQIIIPHRDINGRLIGIRGRHLSKTDVEAGRKYMPINVEGKELSHKLGCNLYGLCQNEEAIRRIGKVIVFESEKSVLLCDTFYHQNNFSVAVCGSNISDTQCMLLRGLGVNEVMIAFDKEFVDSNSNIADLYWQKLIKQAKKLTPYFTVYILWDQWDLLGQKDSPADRGKDVLEALMKNKIEVRTKME